MDRSAQGGARGEEGWRLRPRPHSITSARPPKKCSDIQAKQQHTKDAREAAARGIRHDHGWIQDNVRRSPAVIIVSGILLRQDHFLHLRPFFHQARYHIPRPDHDQEARHHHTQTGHRIG